MRHGRAKAARKTLQYFSRTVGLKAPYSILLDATLVVAMFQQKILPFKERMDRVLQTSGSDGPNRYCIAQTAVEELEMIYEGLKAKNHFKAETFQLALEFIRNECIVMNPQEPFDEQIINDSEKGDKDESTDKRKTSVQDDLLQHIENDERPYVVATQDEQLLGTLRSMGTVPIVRLANSSVLIIENPSKQSQRQFKGVERKKWSHSLQESEQQLVNLAKRQKRQTAKQNDQSTVPTQQRAKTKAKGPNPLSCKRKKGDGDKSGNSTSKKRRDRSKKQKTGSS